MLGSLAGTVVDRWNRKWIMVIANLLQGLLVFWLPLSPGIALIFVIYLAMSIVNQFFVPARSATIPDLVAPEALLTANSLFAISIVAAMAIGPAIGTWITERISLNAAFYTDAATFLIPAMAVAFLAIPRHRRAAIKPSLGSDLRAGLAFARSQPAVLAALATISAAFLVIGTISVAGVVITREILNVESSKFGVMMSALGIGMLVGAIASGWLGRRFTYVQMGVAGVVLMALGMTALPWSIQPGRGLPVRCRDWPGHDHRPGKRPDSPANHRAGNARAIDGHLTDPDRQRHLPGFGPGRAAGRTTECHHRDGKHRRDHTGCGCHRSHLLSQHFKVNGAQKMQYIKSLTELNRADLPIAGGKGANLGALIQAGLPVPPGFCITTPAYRAFVEINKLEAEIHQILARPGWMIPLRWRQPPTPSAPASSMDRCPLPWQMKSARRMPILIHPPGPVAVRSSATAEDLPDLSFAGQQDTYLNILGEDALLDAVIRCWASLWTARAIGYRARNQISHDEVALAVVVQQMVQSEASGVLFTANPLTGKRSETVIDATLGLGEALVSGQVEPDHYVVDSVRGKILGKTLGAKALSIQGQAEGGTITLHHSAADRQALPDEQILALSRLGQQAQTYFGSPQDMEWAWANGNLYVVQSRPVTSLYPLPAGMADEPLEVLLSFGVWQGMLDPYTPLGQDMFSYADCRDGATVRAKNQRQGTARLSQRRGTPVCEYDRAAAKPTRAQCGQYFYRGN